MYGAGILMITVLYSCLQAKGPLQAQPAAAVDAPAAETAAITEQQPQAESKAMEVDGAPAQTSEQAAEGPGAAADADAAAKSKPAKRYHEELPDRLQKLAHPGEYS